MRYWWVNQNQTHEQEQTGGYLWSPVRKTDGARNPYYDFMREVAPGDVVFCYFDRHIQAIGIATSYCFDAPKPAEFGTTGSYWAAWGHRIEFSFLPVPIPVRPKQHIEALRPLLPAQYSPLRHETGDGLQTLYLTSIPEALALALLALGGLDQEVVRGIRFDVLRRSVDREGGTITFKIEQQITEVVASSPLTETEKEQVVLARVGQGAFRRGVLELERRCRVTRIDDPAHLFASHIKPWRSCADSNERIDPHNGLALAPHVDHLFDKGFLSFEPRGHIVLSPLLKPDVLDVFAIDASQRVQSFRDEQITYLDYHRSHVLRKAM